MFYNPPFKLMAYQFFNLKYDKKLIDVETSRMSIDSLLYIQIQQVMGMQLKNLNNISMEYLDHINMLWKMNRSQRYNVFKKKYEDNQGESSLR